MEQNMPSCRNTDHVSDWVSSEVIVRTSRRSVATPLLLRLWVNIRDWHRSPLQWNIDFSVCYGGEEHKLWPFHFALQNRCVRRPPGGCWGWGQGCRLISKLLADSRSVYHWRRLLENVAPYLNLCIEHL